MPGMTRFRSGNQSCLPLEWQEGDTMIRRSLCLIAVGSVRKKGMAQVVADPNGRLTQKAGAR